MKCMRCNAEIASGEEFSHAGQTLCEDCYLDVMMTPKPCDPWAVYTARSSAKTAPVLTPLQQKILNLIREHGPLAAEKICAELKIDEEEFRRNFATLRHMELARASKVDGEVVYTLFQEEQTGKGDGHKKIPDSHLN